jgi:nucleotide-binding universal stress UspA family protein
MTYKSLLVHVEPGREAEQRLQLACDLAERCDALLIGVDAVLLRMPIVDPTGFAAIDPDLIDSERRTLETELAATSETFRTAVAGRQLRSKWYGEIEFPSDALCHHARAADLLIMGRGITPATVSPQHSADLGDVLMRAGRPVLVVPPGQAGLRLEHVLVAWKQTREAQRALADAIPLLQCAGRVSVITISPDADAAVAHRAREDILSYLAAHEIVATHEIRGNDAGAVADEILRAAEQKHCDLIVSGAYGHAPLREWVFGGVTHDLLRKSALPCLLSH